MNLFRGLRSTSVYTRPASQVRDVVPRAFPTTGFTIIPASETVEEERWPWYTPQSFYPVRIGDVLHSKYQVLYKRGYGTTSTVWMCRNLRRDEYVCMKSMVCDYGSSQREVAAQEALSESAKTSEAAGKQYVIQASDHFELSRDDCNYHFLIYEPLGATLDFFLDISHGSLPIFYVKELAYQILQALEFIHGAQVIHADIQAKNILLRIADPTVLKDSEEAEIKDPSARKPTEQTIIFETRHLPGPIERWIWNGSRPVLCDFGEARTGNDSYTELIQPAVYRAPEVFLHLPWGTRVDIWNFGCMVWDLMFGRHLFSRRDAPDELTADKNQLARMVALLGPPPPQLLDDSGPRALEFFNEDGSPKGEAPNETLESVLASSLERVTKHTMTTEESKTFLAFLKRTLTWTEEERPTASELINDPWLEQGNFPRLVMGKNGLVVPSRG